MRTLPFWIFLFFPGPDHDTFHRLLQQERYIAAIEHVADFPEPERSYYRCLTYGLWGDGEEALHHCQQVEGIDNDSDLFHYLYAEALAYYRLREYDSARESIAAARQIAKDWRINLLEAIMDDGDLNGIYVHPLEQQEALRLIPILMFGGLDR